MIARVLRASFWSDWRRKLFAVLNVALGTALATALLNLTLDVGDKMNEELRGFGANLVIVPRSDELPLRLGGVDFNPLARRGGVPLDRLRLLKEIFWRNHVMAFAPFLEERVSAAGGAVDLVGTWFDRAYPVLGDETFRTGLRSLNPWWHVEGAWPEDGEVESALVGARVAEKLGVAAGDPLTVRLPGQDRDARLAVRGVVRTGDGEDDRIFVPLELAQRIRGGAGLVDLVQVSALTAPDNELARQARHNREELTTRELDVWYCSPYVDAIAFQVEEVIPGVQVKPIRRISESEGVVVRKIQLLMAVVTAVALSCSGLGVFSLMTAMIASRRQEIALTKAIGASNRLLMLLFLGEMTLAGVVGGLVGYVAGVGICQLISVQLFASWAAVKPGVIPVVVLLAVAVSLGGSLVPVRLILRVEPSLVLAGE
ncbi:MAG: ABC transporter permease [Candidatus Schekmanbacteria bacterium]|nr:ABC transporter permease [Candidatus Schekmanbacteria bacterium]